MPDHTITLNYGQGGVSANPDNLPIRKGQKLAFRLGTGGPPAGKVRITFHDPSVFSKSQFDDGDADIEVLKDLDAPATYDCDLLVEGVVQKRPEGSTGGGFQPGKG